MSSCRCASVIPGAAMNPRQLTNSTLIPCSFNVGMLTPGSRLSEVIASARNLPAVICEANSLIAAEADGDVSAERLRKHLAAAAEGHVVELAGIAADRLDDHARR